MLAKAPDRMTAEEFLDWEQHQNEKHELIDGRPVLRAIRKGWVGPQAMAGGTTFHDHIAGNVYLGLRSRLRGHPCRAHRSDLAVRVAVGRTRYPDVSVDCAPLVRALAAQQPRVVFEVLSASNLLSDQLALLDDYFGVDTLRQIAFVEQDRPIGVTWKRHEAGWHRERLEGLEAILELPMRGVSLPLTEIYDGVPLESPPA